MHEVQERLNKLIEKKDLTVAEIARRTGIRQSTLSDITKGKAKNPRIDTIVKICEALDMSIDEFIYGNEKRFKTLEKRIEKLEQKKMEKAINIINGVIYTLEIE